MMLKRPSHTLVSNTDAIAITKPITSPRCTLAHVNAKCSCRRPVSDPLPCRRAAAAIIARPSPRPANVPATADASA